MFLLIQFYIYIRNLTDRWSLSVSIKLSIYDHHSVFYFKLGLFKSCYISVVIFKNELLKQPFVHL